MTLTVSSDTTKPGGGFAILRLDGSSLPNEIALEDRSSGLYLAEAGKWSKQPTYFKVDPVDANSVRLGPEIVDFMPSDTPVAVYAAAGGVVGNVVWTEIRPSAGAASGDVLPDRVELDFAKAGVDAIAVAERSPPRSAPLPPLSLDTPIPPPPVIPPVPPVAPAVAAPSATPRIASLRKWLVIAGVVVLALAALATMRNSELAQRLVCNADGPLHEVGIARAIVSCPVPEAPKAPKAPNMEELAYNDFLKCLAGKPGCAQKVCADNYLSAFPSAAHSGDVSSAKHEMERVCQADADSKTSASDFAAFNECIRATANACDRGGCVERFRNRLTTEPYASGLRQAARSASTECKRSQEEAAFATFNQCVAANEACDTAKCASAFTSAFPTSTYVSRVLQVAENSARICANGKVPPQTQPQAPTESAEQAARNFISRYYYVSSSQGEAAGERLETLYAPEVNFYNERKSRDSIINEKIAYNRRWDNRRFYMQQDSLSASCNSTGQICRVVGRVEFDFYSSLLSKASRGVSSFDFLISNALTAPKVIAELSKVEKRF